MIAQSFAEAGEINTKFAPAILTVMSAPEGQVMVRSFLTQMDMPLCTLQLEENTSCRCAYQEAYLRLYSSIRVVLLSSAILYPTEGQKRLRSDLISLLGTQRNFEQAKCPERIVLADTQPIPTWDCTNTAQSVSVSHFWRDRLVKEMSQDANHRSESIVRMVGEVCRDLELRCEDVERPLRNEQSKVKNLEATLQQCEAKVQKLTEDKESSQLQIHHLRDEENRLQQRLTVSEHHLDGMGQKCEMLRRDLDRNDEVAQHAANFAAESARQQDLSFLAILTGKDELIESQASKLAANAQQNQVLEDTVAQLRSQLALMTKETQADKGTIESLKKTQSGANELLKTKEADIKRLADSEANLLANVESVTRESKETSSKTEDIITGLESRVRTADTENLQLRDDYRREKAEKTDFMSIAHQAQLEVGNLQNDLLQARREAAQSVATRDSTIAKFESKLLTLERERQARAREIAEAQDLGGRLMAIVGKKQISPFVPTTNTGTGYRPSQEASECKTIRAHQLALPQVPNLKRTSGAERFKRRRNARSSPITLADASFASDFTEANSTTAVGTNRNPLIPHSSAPNRGQIALERPGPSSKVPSACHASSEHGDENVRSHSEFSDANAFGDLADYQTPAQQETASMSTSPTTTEEL